MISEFYQKTSVWHSCNLISSSHQKYTMSSSSFSISIFHFAPSWSSSKCPNCFMFRTKRHRSPRWGLPVLQDAQRLDDSKDPIKRNPQIQEIQATINLCFPCWPFDIHLCRCVLRKTGKFGNLDASLMKGKKWCSKGIRAAPPKQTWDSENFTTLYSK